MSTVPPVENEFDKSSINIQFLLLIMLATMTGLLAAILLLPVWLPDMAASLVGDSPKVYWYLSRATAFVSLSILWISMALGLGMTNKMARLWPGAPAAFAIHEYVSLLGLSFVLFHALVLLGDHYINFTVAQIFLPFSTVNYRPTWVGIGQIGFYVGIIVALSFYVRQSIGQKTWRLIHYLSFAMYIMGLLHGLFSGTDTTASWAQWYYWISGGTLLFLLIYRIVNTIMEKLTRRPEPAAQTPRLSQVLTRSTNTPTVPKERSVPADLPSVASAIPVSEAKPTSSAYVKKYETGSGENRVNVRIFKEPTTEPIIPEPQRDAKTQRVDATV